MDPERYGEAIARLEEEYLAGGMSADEYTRRRRELDEDASADAEEPAAGHQPMPALAEAAEPRVLAEGDPVTGAPLASWGRRAGGWCVDLLVYFGAFLASFLVALPTEDPETGEISDAAALLIFFVWFVGPTLYAWLMVGWRGQTLGKMAVGIRVERAQDAERVSYFRALARAVSTWVLGILALPLLVAYLWPLWDRRNQTLYDKMAGTIVVRVGGESARPA